MLSSSRVFAFDLADDLFSQHLTEFNAPLVEGVDLPDSSLREDAVLIQGDKLAERFGREFFQQNGVRRTVAFKNAVRNEPVWRPFCFYLGGCLPKSQSFRLGKDIGHQEIVVIAERIQRFGKPNEVAGDQARSLMNELIERVLAVRARFAPEDRSCVVRDALSVKGDVLPVALHGELLQVRREAFEVLVVGQNSYRLGIEEVGVPDGEQAHQDGQVLLKWRRAEMLINRMEAREHFAEVLRPDGEHR